MSSKYERLCPSREMPLTNCLYQALIWVSDKVGECSEINNLR